MDGTRLPPRLTPLAAIAAGGLLAAAQLGLLTGSGRYGAYLAAFAIWMAWFVQTVAGLLRDPDEPPS
jgi:hypothetical protein